MVCVIGAVLDCSSSNLPGAPFREFGDKDTCSLSSFKDTVASVSRVSGHSF